ncbi:MAG: decarboxylating 6-phosphogluconate dehydrogenase, partial [Chloroflexi bacterium]|nr:decarboxylating 6-phosphogluconate dehydrogenase [Chloroflexota bacterium]
MQLGMIGLGRMGGNMTSRLLRGGHQLHVFDFSEEAIQRLAQEGAVPSASMEALVGGLNAPRAVWVMVPAGQPTQDTVDALAKILSPGDAIIDGGNANYKDSMRRAQELSTQGISFIDCGTSGGVWGLEGGYSLMVGGERAAVERLEPIFRTLAPDEDRGYAHVGPSGAGHFVKMVHNGIEYGLMQAYAEGFQLLEAKEELGLNLPQIAEVWRHGSVVRSWLLDLTADALQENPSLEGIQAYVDDSGEGRWMVAEAVDLASPAPVITLAL